MILVVGVIMFNRDFSAQGANPQIHKNELSEHGLFILNSTDDAYESDLRELLKDKNTAFQEVARTLRASSIFIKNTNSKDVLSYKLNWEIKMSDGRVVNYPRTYFAPDYLMGVSRSNLYDKAMQTIKKNGSRFFTMIPTPFESDSGSTVGAVTQINEAEVKRFQDAARKGEITPFIVQLNEKISQATDITVSIESVLFDDGSFVGPPSDPEFVKLKASITAKYDLLKEINTLINTNKIPVDKVLVRVSRIADEDIPMPTPTSYFTTYYNFFRKHQAQEIISASRAVGEEEAISVFLKRLDRKWIIPYEYNAP